MGGSRKLRSRRMFVGNGAGAGNPTQDLARGSLPSPRISVKCHDSVLRKSPGGIERGFRRRRLREGRRSEDGAEFTRVIDKAVARIRRLRAGTGMVDDPPQDRAQQGGLHLDMLQKDGLQKVRFEAFAEARDGEDSSMQNLRRQLNRMRQFAVPVVDDDSREILRGDVLQFGPPREKKVKALGSDGKSD
jgi:hypothetical protein